MTRKDFVEMPEWVKYVAMDKNGAWWGFECEPYISKDVWATYVGRGDRLKPKKNKPIPRWFDSLSELV